MAMTNRYGKRPPKNYKVGDMPLTHNREFSFGMTAKLNPTTGGNGTILPISYHDEEVRDPSSTNVNPRHASFGETTEMGVNSFSIMPRVNLSWRAWMTDDAITTLKLKHIQFQYMPIYCSFKEDLDAEDDRTGKKITDILRLQYTELNEETYPIFNTTDMLNGTTLGSLQLGLDTDLTIEEVDFDPVIFHEAFRFYGNGKKLSACVGNLRTVTLNHNGNPFVYSNKNFGDGKVKRGNSFMFCGMLFRCAPLTYSPQSIPFGTTITDNKSQIEVAGRVIYDEWNYTFDQESD